jgi:16S rRNA (uracil1498-N3)-methyltransferase
MRHFFLPDIDFQPGQTILLPAELLRHIHRVLRLTVGEEFQLFNGSGLIAQVRLQQGGQATVLEIFRSQSAPLSACLIQGLPKGEKLELVLQKGTELGVSRFCLVEMERSIGRLKQDKRDRRLERWRKIVQEAARQCGQSRLPELQLCPSLEQAAAENQAELKLLLWEKSGQALPALLPTTPPKSVAVIVGPEGGISPQEAQQACSAGFLPASLGPRILRTETAGLAIMSILQYLYGDLSIGQVGRNTAFQGKDAS